MFPSSSALVVVTIFFILQYLLQRLWTRILYEIGVLKNGCEKPPKLPSYDPIFNLDITLTNLKARKEHRCSKMDHDNFTKYGHTLQNPFFGRRAIQTIDHKNFQTIMFTKSNSFIVARDWALKPMIGLGILDTDGAAWVFHRSMVKSMFSRSQINDPASFEVHFSRMLKLIPKDGSTVDLRPLFNRLNMDAQSEFVFGESIETLLPDNQAARDFMQHLENAMNGSAKRLFAGKWSHLIQEKSYWESCTFVRKYVSALIDRALARERDSERSRRVLVYEFAKQAESREQLLDYLFNVFMPGKDTPGTLLGHVFFACARNPHVWDKLRAEVRKLKQEVLDFESLKGLKYMQYVFNEVFRLYPVLDQTGRTAAVPVVLPRGGGPSGDGPIYLEAGSVAIINFWSMNRRPEVYGNDAHLFRPERWETQRTSWEFAPFSRGPRACPAQNLAMFWAGYALVRLVQMIEQVENRDGTMDFVEDLRLTHGSFNGVKVGLKFTEGLGLHS